jgi:hypothetical protein
MADLWTAYLGLRRRCKHLAVHQQREHRRPRLAALGQLPAPNPRSFWRQLSGLLGTRGGAAQRLRVAAVRGAEGLASDDAGRHCVRVQGALRPPGLPRGG